VTDMNRMKVLHIHMSDRQVFGLPAIIGHNDRKQKPFAGRMQRYAFVVVSLFGGATNTANILGWPVGF
jgi:hypothetical protein